MSDAAAWLSEGPVPPPSARVIEIEPPLSGGAAARPPEELCFPDGRPNPLAVRYENRRRADSCYLAVFRETRSHDEAAAVTCDQYGHEARGGRCARCGRGVTAEEVRHSRP